ncbi:IS91 family transposase [Sedimenticola hydrogenitrophicus]|uniref:IS91 family transposase n=1 Tax=Sedimenticola hydrogenitrophicus TaxID=2967975 RepID=UPI0021A91C9B|nr:transposase [Sedimenticola hydrogenitrophicus]
MRLSSIITAFEAPFLAQYQEYLLPSHRRALAAMKDCRSQLGPKMQAACDSCHHQMLVPHSCGHRNCPHCQSHESQQWIERQLKKQLPADYFLLTFTLPAELRSLAWRHQRAIYTPMTRCSWETVCTFSQNDRQLQGMPGATTVLHTHSRRLDYHPHIHMVVPAAAIHVAKRLWRTKKGKGKRRYLFNHKALAKVFRAKLLAAISQAGLALPDATPKDWVVDCKAVGSGDKALVYLGRYLYRGVIQEQDIVACENGQVTFRYRNGKTREIEYRTVPGAQFLWLIVQHVLPKGFRRARNYGFLHPNSKRLIQLIQYLLNLDPNRGVAWMRARPKLICRCCGAPMKIIRTRIFPEPRCKIKTGIMPMAM